MKYIYKYLCKNLILSKKTIFWNNSFLIEKTFDNNILVYNGCKFISFNSTELKERNGFLLKDCFLTKKIGRVIHKERPKKKKKK